MSLQKDFVKLGCLDFSWQAYILRTFCDGICISLLCFYSELFINELPDNKKIRTYAKQKPIQLKRHLRTVEVDYEKLFLNGMMINKPSVLFIHLYLIYNSVYRQKTVKCRH